MMMAAPQKDQAALATASKRSEIKEEKSFISVMSGGF